MTTAGISRSVLAPSIRRTALRRWPALLMMVVAAVLALALPSGLTIPQSGPTTLAEYAPVPGAGEGQSDISDLGQGSSGDLGFGSGTGGTAGDLPPPVTQKRPRLKRCVGNPPRQTEDPRSPPCVAFFEGNNFGSTMKGVTGDEITIVVHLGQASSRFPAGFTDWSKPIDGTEDSRDRYGKAYARYFNERYQTYGREVRFFGYRSPTVSSSPAQKRADVAEIDKAKSPFALLTWEEPAIPSEEAASRGTFAATYSAFLRRTYQRFEPLLISFAPDLEDQADNFADYVCTKVAGRTAKHAPDPRYHSRIREFGILYTEDPSTPQYAEMKDELIKALDRRCGVKIKIVVGKAASPDQVSSINQLRAADITTVITIANSGTSSNQSQSAGAQQWYPEWLISGVIADELGNYHRESAELHNQVGWSGAFGITFDYRRDEFNKQNWNIAYREACRGCPDDGGTVLPRFYDTLAMLFYGIQSAGPRLTPANFDKGMHSIPQRGSPDPYRPAAYFAADNYSYIKDAMEIWWDPTATPPGDTRKGCFRLPNDGRRFRANDWTGDDSQVFSEGPCQASQAKPPGT
ncbi:MAG TPA: hypothetical protein VND22_02070 [Actinomycetota bacterium]|nr:hypothetical protein [Actinomycetota bacterium]